MGNALFYGDNLAVLRESIATESVDLVYLDPPFNSNANYNVLFKSLAGSSSQAQIEAFEDTWHWGQEAEDAFDQVIRSGNTDAADMLRAVRSFLGDNDMMAYLAMMTVRLIQLHRVLKPTGSLYLHCDPTAGHYLKVMLDSALVRSVFAVKLFGRDQARTVTPNRVAVSTVISTMSCSFTQSPRIGLGTRCIPLMQTRMSIAITDSSRKGRVEHFRRGDLTAAKPGGDTEYKWRVKKHEGATERWEADIDDEYLKPKSGWEYKGVSPYKGRFWAYSKENMCQFAREGRLRHTFEGMPEYKRYLDEMPGVPLQDLWTDI